MPSLLRRVIALATVLVLLSPLARPLQAEEPHWDYYSHGGAENWGDLYPACDLPGGSPIDIEGVQPETGLSLSYAASPLVVVNTGHSIQVNVGRGSSLTVDGQRFELLQFHFHAPSEHTFAGVATALEVHFVHRGADGGLAVLGALLREGPENAAFGDILALAPDEPGSVASSRTADPAALLPAGRAFYDYEGSLTTPPCSGGVRWYVLSEMATVSPGQVAAFRDLSFLNHDGHFTGNARPVQPLDGRLGDSPRITAPSTGDGGLAALSR